MAFNVAAAEYKAKKQVAEIVLENGGIVFGGFVRDSVLHDHFATKFYDSPDVNAFKYNNNEYLPEYSLRTVIPVDIDCFFDNPEDFTKFLASLKEAKFITRGVRSRDPKRYMPNIQVEDGELMHYKLSVRPMQVCDMISKIMENVPESVRRETHVALSALAHRRARQAVHMFTVDAMVKAPTCERALFPPFNAPDFECNSLMITQHGIALLPELARGVGGIYDRHTKLTSIINDIVDRKAQTTTTAPTQYRYIKMQSKGWTVHGSTISQCTFEHDDMCIICTEHFNSSDCFKLSCCNAKYHSKCLHAAVTREETGMAAKDVCLHCRQHTNVFMDVEFLNAIKGEDIE